MKLLVALTCLLAGCLAQKPHPCTSPPLMSGSISMFTQRETLWVYGKYLYDALRQRTRLIELGTTGNKTFTYDVLLLFREAVMYEIHQQNRTCRKKPLKADFEPLAIPKNASLLGQNVLGSLSGPGQGLLVNMWMGDVPGDRGKYISTVTEFGCIPVSTLYQHDRFGWLVMSFLNNVVGISEPSLLIPPDFCPDAEMRADSDEEPADFLSVFFD